MISVTSLSGTQSTITFTLQAQRTTILDTTNPAYPRNVTLGTQGLQFIKGTNAVGIALEDLWLLVIQYLPQLTWPPTITLQPSPQQTTYGGTANFTIAANSEAAANYQWQSSPDQTTWTNVINTGGVYAGATKPQLNILNSAGLSSTYYQCVVTNISGTTTSSDALLTTTANITVQPSNQSVTHPSPATFAMTAASELPLAYQWFALAPGQPSGSPITDSSIYTGTLTNTLVVNISTGLNGYLYYCAVTNAAGTVNTNKASLTVA